MKMPCIFCPSIGGSFARVKSVRRHDCGIIIPSGCYTVITQLWKSVSYSVICQKVTGIVSKTNIHYMAMTNALHCILCKGLFTLSVCVCVTVKV